MKKLSLLLSCIYFTCLSCYPQSDEGKCQLKGFTTADINIYNEIDGVIIMQLYLPYGIEGAEHVFDIVKAKGTWLKISIPTLHNSTAWIHAGSLNTATRNYNNEPIPLYQEPDKESKVVGELHGQQIVLIYGGLGNWAYIKGKGKAGKEVEGWLEPEMQCPNPYTTCPTPVY